MNKLYYIVIEIQCFKIIITVFDIATSKVVYKKSYAILLGKTLQKSTIITAKSLVQLERTIESVKILIERKYRPFQNFIIATEVLRNVKNKEDVNAVIIKYFPKAPIPILDGETSSKIYPIELNNFLDKE